MSNLNDLLKDIFENQRPAFYPDFENWVKDSRRFRSFAETYRRKIGTKVRHIQGTAEAKELRSELEAAAVLLRETRFTLEYEKYLATKQRSPDFTVTFKTHTLFNVEVRHLRSTSTEGDTAELQVRKLISVICEKVGQLPPGSMNLLWLTAEEELSQAEVVAAHTWLRQQAEGRVETFFMRQGLGSAAAFLKHYSRLSAIVLHQPKLNAVWLNPLARHKLLPEIVNALQKL